MRVTQSNTGFDFRCGPQIQVVYLSFVHDFAIEETLSIVFRDTSDTLPKGITYTRQSPVDLCCGSDYAQTITTIYDLMIP